MFVKEIIDHLNKSKNQYAINCLASGGDWIANILYEQEYIEKLSLIKPDVFLISGGGNDIVGDYRLAQLVQKRSAVGGPENPPVDTFKDRSAFGAKCLNKEFFALLNLFKMQYKLLFQSIKQKTNKFENLRVITQGYDYAVPSSKKGWGIVRPLLNHMNGNGKWLKTPLLLNGYKSQNERVSIVTAMIHFFNEMLIDVGKEYDNVFHIDCRGFVDPENGWFDELHPKSRVFKKIARVFTKCIEADNPDKKVFTVFDD